MVLRLALTVPLLVALLGGPGAAEEPDVAALRAQMVRNIEVWTHITAEETGVSKIDPRVRRGGLRGDDRRGEQPG